jgi:hypothetical protein
VRHCPTRKRWQNDVAGSGRRQDVLYDGVERPTPLQEQAFAVAETLLYRTEFPIDPPTDESLESLEPQP